MRKFVIIFLLVFAVGFFQIKPAIAATKFETTVKREYRLQGDLTVNVKEVETVKNNTNNLYVPSGSKKEFEILAIEIGADKNAQILEKTLASASLTSGGRSIPFNSQIVGDKVILTSSYPHSLEPRQSITFTLEYTHYGLTEQNGALKDFFINGFSKDSVFSDGSNTTSYTTDVYVPNSYDETNFILPTPATQEQQTGYKKISFSQNSLIDHYVWIQFGRTQYYKFAITQPIKGSENMNTGNKNRYEIVIPRSIEGADIRQSIYYTKITPEPDWVKQDQDGNLIASFKLKSNFQGDIVLEGYAEISKIQDIDFSNFGELADIPADFSTPFLQAAQYWEVDDPLIQQTSSQLKGTKIQVSDIVQTTYNYVVDQIDYSDVKRFGINERQGAVKTLQGGAAVCMEYSDLFLTLMRSQGIPARAAFGYGYDPKENSDSQESHQWVEVYAPGYDSWISVDVTWGENGPALIGGDLNHFYTHVASVSPNDPPAITSYGFGNLDLQNSSYDINVVSSIPAGEMLNQEDLLNKYTYHEESLTSNVVDLTQSKLTATYSNLVNGEQLSSDQFVIIISTVMLVLALLFINLALLKKFYRRFSRKDSTSSQQFLHQADSTPL